MTHMTCYYEQPKHFKMILADDWIISRVVESSLVRYLDSTAYNNH